jgi:rubredoxin
MAWITGTKHTHWEAHSVCEKCGHHKYVPHADLFFAPNYCPECGAKDNHFRKVRMKYVYEERDEWGWFSWLLPRKGHWEVHHRDIDSAPEHLIKRIS